MNELIRLIVSCNKLVEKERGKGGDNGKGRIEKVKERGNADEINYCHSSH